MRIPRIGSSKSPSRFWNTRSRTSVIRPWFAHEIVATLFTIGHSTRPLEDLIATLQAHEIQTLVDIRAFPMSRRLPQFNRDSLQESLPAAGIRYAWMKALGGYRKKIRDDSPNIALRNASFRNYADYMLTGEFKSAMAELVALAGSSLTAYMCAERVYFRCHRMLVSDWLVAHGHEVLHIDGTGPAKPHRLTAEARMVDGELVYRGDRLL
jgi:uncharacterized protein (DUF488 family)